MSNHDARDPRLDCLALGVKCTTCGSSTDEPCTTRRSGNQTAPHSARIDRAVKLYLERKES